MRDPEEVADLLEDHGIPITSYIAADEPTETVEAEPGELYDVLEAIGVSPYEGETAGWLDCGESLDLLAVTTAMPLPEVAYEPSVFSGVVFARDIDETTVIIFDDGHLVTVDAPGEEVAREALVGVYELLEELRLVEQDLDAVEVGVDVVPVRV